MTVQNDRDCTGCYGNREEGHLDFSNLQPPLQNVPLMQGEVNRVTHDKFPGTFQAHCSTHGRRSSLQPIIIFKKYSLSIVCVPGTATDARNTARN